MLLLDERQEVLTLVTNSIDRDLQSEDPLIVGLALSALGNIGSEEMCRDLTPAVEGCLKVKNPYIRKKAALATIRILKKAPDLAAGLVPRIIGLLTDGSHSVLLTGVTLIGHLLDLRPAYAKKFARLVPALCKILRKLATATFAGEYTIGGVTDPFLQAKILSLLRRLGEKNAEASDAMNDILAHVATNTPVARNAGNAILYEAVRTMMGVHTEPALRSLSVNILARFLLHKDNNIRYVALQTLGSVVAQDRDLVSQHTSTVVECLRDPDISIRRRAMDLAVALVDKENVQNMVGEMLNYLIVEEGESRSELCSKIAAVASKHAPSLEWQLGVLVSMVALAGDVAKRQIFSQLIYLVTVADEELQARTVHRLFGKVVDELRSPELKRMLLATTVWCVGECGQFLLSPPPTPPPGANDLAAALIGGTVQQRSEDEVVALLARLLTHYLADSALKGMVLSAALKLSSRLSSPGALQSLQRTLRSLEGSLDTELQQRSVEFSAIASGSVAGAPLKVLVDVIPSLDPAVLATRAGVEFDTDTLTASLNTMGTAAASAADLATDMTAVQAAPAQTAAAADVDDDLFDLLGGGGTPTPSAAAPPPLPVSATGAPGADLDDLFGGGVGTPTETVQAPAPVPAAAGGGAPDLDDLFGGGPSTSAAAGSTPPGPATFGPAQLYADAAAGLNVTAVFTEEGPAGGANLSAVATFSNTGSASLGSCLLQVAVPKGMTCKMGPAASGSIDPGQSLTQSFSIVNPMRGQKALALKIRVTYAVGGGQATVHTTAVRGLPAGL